MFPYPNPVIEASVSIGAPTAVYATNESLTEQTGATSYNGAAITFTPAASTDYLFFWSQDVQNSSTAGACQTDLSAAGSSIFATLPIMTPVDSISPVDYFSMGGIFRYQSGGSPSSTVFQLSAARSGASGTFKLKNSRLSYIKMGSGDAYAQSLTRQTFTDPSNKTAQTAASITFTPASTGNYIFVLSCLIDLSSTSNVVFGLELTDGTNTTGEITFRPVTTADRMPVMLVLPISSVSGSKTVNVKVRQTGSGSTTIGVAEIRIVAIREDRFAHVHKTTLGSANSGTQATYTNALTQGPTVTAGDHLTFACAAFGNNQGSSLSSQVRFTDGGTTVNEMNRAFNIFLATSANGFSGHRLATYAAGTQTQNIDRLSETTSATTTIQAKSAAIVTLDLAGIS